MNEAYVEKSIKDVNETDQKVAVSGCIISKEENSIVIDDGDSRMAVFLNNFAMPTAKYIRVFGRVIPYEEGVQIQADLIQDLSSINVELYKKMLGMMKQRSV